MDFYATRGVRVVVLSEYGITPVRRSIALNRVFRARGWLTVKDELGLELLDCGASRAFAIADHQIAHIYINDPAILGEVRAAVEAVEGVERVFFGSDFVTVTKAVKPVVTLHPVELRQESVQACIDQIGAVWDGIRKSVYPTRPGWPCKTCPYASKCPAAIKHAGASDEP